MQRTRLTEPTSKRTFSAITIALFLGLVLAGCIPDAGQVPNSIVFAGKVVDSRTGEWPNDRLVLLFLNGKEIGRTVTALGEFPESGEGITDGVFSIRTENTYKLDINELNEEEKEFFAFGWKWKAKAVATEYTFAWHWFDGINQGTLASVYIPSKNITYSIKVLEGNVSALPPELQVAGSTVLRDDSAIVVTLDTSSSEEVPIDSGTQVQKINYDTSQETIEVNKITVPINNCGGSATISQKYVQSQTFIREYHVEVQASLGAEIPVVAWLKLVPELQAKYGFEQGQIDTQTVEYEMAAEPNTSLVYVITWKEVWESGTADLLSGNQIISIPFRVKTNLIYQIDSESMGCD